VTGGSRPRRPGTLRWVRRSLGRRLEPLPSPPTHRSTPLARAPLSCRSADLDGARRLGLPGRSPSDTLQPGHRFRGRRDGHAPPPAGAEAPAKGDGRRRRSVSRPRWVYPASNAAPKRCIRPEASRRSRGRRSERLALSPSRTRRTGQHRRVRSPIVRSTGPVAHPPSLQSDDFREIRVDKRTLGLRVAVTGWQLRAEARRRPPVDGPHVFRPHGPGFGPAAPPKRRDRLVRCPLSRGRRAPRPRRFHPTEVEWSHLRALARRSSANPLQPACPDDPRVAPPAASDLPAARPRRRPRDPAAALLCVRTVVAVAGGHAASLATLPGCRRPVTSRSSCRRKPRFRWACGAATFVRSWPAEGTEVSSTLATGAETPVVSRALRSLAHDPGRRRAACVSLRKTSPTQLVAAGSAFPPHLECLQAQGLAVPLLAVPGLAARHWTAAETTARHLRQSPASAGVCRPAPSRPKPVLCGASARGSCHGRPQDQAVCGKYRDAVDTCSTAFTRPSCAPPAEAGDTFTDRVFSALPRREPRSVSRSETETCSTLGDRLIFRAFLPSRVRCTQTGVYAVWGPVLSWVFNLSRVSPLIALGRCYHQPSSHRLGMGPCSRRSLVPRPVLRERRSAASQSFTER
jgi:hypothetical protein